MPSAVKEYFEERAQHGTWASLYDGMLDARSYNFITRREAVLGLLQGHGVFGHVLDIGCGTGDYAQVAWRHGGVYHGVDFSHAMIAQARARLNGSGERYQLLVASGEGLPYRDDAFDLVLAIGYIEYFRDPTASLREIRRVLKSGGVLVMQSYKRELCGNLYRFLINPIRRLSYGLRGRGVSSAPPMDVDRPYSQRRFDGLLGNFGFVRTGHMFNHFAVLPDPFRSRFPRLYTSASESMRRSHPALWSFLAINYIGKYMLRKAR